MADSALKVGIIRLSSLGDIISTVVFLDFIRAKFRQCGQKIEITFIVDTQFREILADSAMIDRIIDLPLRASKKNKKLLFEIYKKTRQLGRFDILIDAQGLLKSALIGTLIKKKKFVGFSADSAREKVASLFYNKRAKISYNAHILKRQYELFKVAFDEVAWEGDFRLQMLDSRNRTIDSSKSAKAKIAEILAPHKANKKILFLCETSKADKEFSLTSFYAIADGLWSDYKKATIFLIWDKKENEIRALGARDSRFCVLPHLDFDEIKALLGSMDLVIGGDTGITHTAWAMRVPSVTLYISTDIERFALGGENHFSISGGGNLSLGLHSTNFANLGRLAQTSSLALRPKFAKNHESQTENPSVVDSAKSQNLEENQSQNAESTTFCNATIFCHSERSEESQKKNNRDSSPAAQNDNLRKFAESSLDSANTAPSTHEANSTIADEFLGFCEASDKDKTKVHRGSEPKRALRKQLAHTCKSLKSRCESEFALDSAIIAQILHFTKKALV